MKALFSSEESPWSGKGQCHGRGLRSRLGQIRARDSISASKDICVLTDRFRRKNDILHAKQATGTMGGHCSVLMQQAADTMRTSVSKPLREVVGKKTGGADPW